MNKADLLKFLDLYNLNGNVEAVKIVSDGKSVKTNFVSDDRTLAGAVSFSSLKIDEGEYGIYDTAQLRKMLAVLTGDTMTVEVNKFDDKAISFCFSDKTSESICMLADLSVIPPSPKVKEIKSFEVEIPIDDDFVERFVRAKNALPDVVTFTIMPNKKGDKLEMLIGYSTINTNRVKLEIKPTAGKDKLTGPISFNAIFFKEILSKNRGVNSILKIAAAGIASIHFKTDSYEATYYLIKKDTE
jgi:hypothetical protein